MASVVEFEHVSFPPRPKTTLVVDVENTAMVCERPGKPLTAEELDSLLDTDGRLVDEHKLRKLVFRGGCNTSVRKDVWKFLFRLFPANSTKRERTVLLNDYAAKYAALKSRWKALVRDKVDTDGDKFLEPSYLRDVPKPAGEEDCTDSSAEIVGSPGTQQQNIFLNIQAQVYAGRQELDWSSLRYSVRVIDKDVPRTDRELDYFKGATNPNLWVLRSILITFAAYHPEVGYVQGMNDLVSLFLQVFNSEVEAYWCFEHYMSLLHVQEDFLEGGMLTKLSHVSQLLQELDPDLMNYLDTLGISDMTMCHRWMLLSFKREFPLADTLRCFEILRSQHLEVYCLEAEKAKEEQRRTEFQRVGGTSRVTEAVANRDFTFDVFMCTSILMQNRDDIFYASEGYEVFQLIMSLSKKLNLDVILQKGEVLFFKYCKQAATECFQILELPSTPQNTVNTGR